MLPTFTVWQDYLFFVGQLCFFVALVPAMRSAQKPPLSSCAMTFSILLTFIPANLTLGLYLSTVMTCLTASAWGILTFQRLHQTLIYKALTHNWRIRKTRSI